MYWFTKIVYTLLPRKIIKMNHHEYQQYIPITTNTDTNTTDSNDDHDMMVKLI